MTRAPTQAGTRGAGDGRGAGAAPARGAEAQRARGAEAQRPRGAEARRPRGAETPRPVLTVYSKPGCHLCEEAIALARAFCAELGCELRERDIADDDALLRAYFERIPVVELDGEELCEYVFDEQIVRERLESRA